MIASANVDRFTKFFYYQIPEEILYRCLWRFSNST